MKSLITVLLVLAPQLVFASEEAAQETAVQENGGVAAEKKPAPGKKQISGLQAIGAAIAIAVGALGGALGQGRLAAAAMEGIARNPQAGKTMFVPFMIGLGLIESLVIYCLIIAMRLSG